MRNKRRRLPRAANQTVQLKVRLLEELRRRLEREAARNGRSMNLEIVERLQRSFQIHDDQIDTIATSLISNLEPRVVERIVQLVQEDQIDYDDTDERLEAERKGK
jgi:Arc-like DNA binding domain